MKKLFILLVIVLLYNIVLGQKAKIAFKEFTHDFGEVFEKDGDVNYVFEYENLGDVPLILTNVRAGCGCTTPEWSRKPLAPKEKAKLTITFDPRNRPGIFMKSVTVSSNAENAVVTLIIKGNVTIGARNPFESFIAINSNIKASTDNLNFGKVLNTSKSTKTINILNTGKETVSVSASSAAKCIKTSVSPAKIKPGESGTVYVEYNAKEKADWGYVSDKISIYSKPGNSGNITISANIVEDFSGMKECPVAEYSSKGTSFGSMSKNMLIKREITVKNNGNADLIIHKIKTSDNNVIATTRTPVIKAGKSGIISINIKTGNKSGQKIQSVTIITNDPKNSIVSYSITGEVR